LLNLPFFCIESTFRDKVIIAKYLTQLRFHFYDDYWALRIMYSICHVTAAYVFSEMAAASIIQASVIPGNGHQNIISYSLHDMIRPLL